MNREMGVVDQESRTRALDPSTSFIVQAPAGSGKTGLLTQRFLVLLTGVDAPEEIVAITFTRKAAGEMRQRILEALDSAHSEQPPEKDHDRLTWELARKALSRDQEKGWQLLENPARLRIQTIDSFGAALARQMPVLSQFGSVPATTEDADPLYFEAAGNAIAEMESREAWSDAVAHLVRHMDNRLDKLQNLISTMLAKRDQWLRHVADPDHPRLERENLERVLTRLVTDCLNELAAAKPVDHEVELLELIRFAAKNLQDGPSPIAEGGDLQQWPGVQVENRCQWEALAELLLTKEGSWRKAINKNQGFPAPGGIKNAEEKAHVTQMKERMIALLGAMDGEEEFQKQLHALRTLPSHEYTDGEWETLCALVELLRIAAAHLKLVFGQHRQVDFPALTLAAIWALGEQESPTDLALALDYRIRHLLVDEFQDTSFNQYELLKRLTAGWQPEDGHTLFVVGDPMQSIYRFREAQVGLFLATREYGIGQVPLEFLRLEVNFRSQQGIVDWINQHFPEVLPVDNVIATGAVSYAPSTAFHPPQGSESVFVYPSLERDDYIEAQQVVSIVQQAKSENPDGTTAILVRGRAHLEAIIDTLQEAGIRFQAVEIERLAHRQVVQDLLALTRALTHIGDRIAWLAILRAPYCGLTLDDLYILVGNDHDSTVIDLLHQEERLSQLSKDGQSRLARVLPVLDNALSEQARCSLRDYVEGVWNAIGGPACVEDETDLEDGEVYFQLLEKIGNSGDDHNIEELNRQVKKMFALPDVEADGSLQLMTIYKSKGLEFDTVIVPGLGRAPRADDTKLLHWLEHGLESGGSDLLLAPISAEGMNKNLIESYLQQIDKTKGHFENGRLLYVAATRAKRDLHLLGHTTFKEDEDGFTLNTPSKNSLLESLWPVLEKDFQSALAEHQVDASQPEEPIESIPGRIRLAKEWSLPSTLESVQVDYQLAENLADDFVEFDWAGETARHVGNVVHRLFQYLGDTGIDRIKPEDRQRLKQAGQKMLERIGVPKAHFDDAIAKIGDAIESTVDDTRGQWILSGQHENARCELALSGHQDGKVKHMVIDRTFVDEQGTRWIIDYKTGTHTGGGVDAFLDREQERYSHQLESYARALSKIEERPIRMALYYPLLKGWREWPFQKEG